MGLIMTQEEFDRKLKEVKAQEDKFGVEIEITDIIDKDHLDCTWYGGEVGTIEYKGYIITIGAYGDIRLGGLINGTEVYVKDKRNGGAAYEELGCELTDDDLHRLLNSDDENNYLTFENSNWFEVDLISPEGDFIDLCYADNVLENNLLECFSSVEDYFEYVDDEIKRRTKNEQKI